MKYGIMFLLAACASLFIGCTSTSPTSPTVTSLGCSVETLATTAIAGAIASTDSCTNVTQMQSDIQGALGSINLCQSAAVQAQLSKLAQKSVASGKDKGLVGSIVCPLAVDAVMTLIGTKVPATWGCTGSSSVSAAISLACTAVVPI